MKWCISLLSDTHRLQFGSVYTNISIIALIAGLWLWEITSPVTPANKNESLGRPQNVKRFCHGHLDVKTVTCSYLLIYVNCLYVSLQKRLKILHHRLAVASLTPAILVQRHKRQLLWDSLLLPIAHLRKNPLHLFLYVLIYAAYL